MPIARRGQVGYRSPLKGRKRYNPDRPKRKPQSISRTKKDDRRNRSNRSREEFDAIQKNIDKQLERVSNELHASFSFSDKLTKRQNRRRNKRYRTAERLRRNRDRVRENWRNAPRP